MPISGRNSIVSLTTSKIEDDKKDGEQKEGEEAPAAPQVGFFELWKYCTWDEVMMLWFAAICSVALGVLMPLMFLYFGEMVNGGSDDETAATCYGFAEKNEADEYVVNVTAHPYCEGVPLSYDIVKENMYIVNMYVKLAAYSFLLSTISVYLYSAVAHVNEQRIKMLYFKAMLRQEMAFYDVETTPGELNVQLTDDIAKIKAGSNYKVAATWMNLSMGISGLVMGFYYSAKLSGVIIVSVPLMCPVMVIAVSAMGDSASEEQKAYAGAGEVANEVILAIRTVTAFCAQKMELFRYDENLLTAKEFAARMGWIMGMTLGSMNLIFYGMYAASFYYGTVLFDRDPPEIDAGGLVATFFGIVFGAFGLGACFTHFEAFTNAMTSAHKVFSVIDRESKIDPTSEAGIKLDSNTPAAIELKNVSFSYPSRTDQPVLKSVNMEIKQGETVAFVGASGCGKSTIIQLIQRFYDVEGGSIFVGGHDVRQLNVASLRNSIGVVRQEPILFATTIAENIALGKSGSCTEEEIQKALQDSNAGFVAEFPQGLETQVGDKGGHLSGGQKQRIAIARAIVSNPKILLLDEATSALDGESEKVVQKALNKASQGRTTIIIAHRLSTVRNADRIFGVRNGEVVEVGTHNELYDKPNGLYRALVDAQSAGMENNHGDLEKKRSSVISSKDVATVAQKTTTATESSGDDSGEKEDELPNVTASDVLQYNRPEYLLMFIGLIFAVVSGWSDPIGQLIFSDMIMIYADPQKQNLWEDCWRGVYLFMGLSVAVLTANTIGNASFGTSGAYLIRRIRFLYFQAVMRQEMDFFDDPRYPAGMLTSRLSTDCSKIAGVAGLRLNALGMAFGSTLLALGIGLYYSYELSALFVILAPMLVLGGILDIQLNMTNPDLQKTEGHQSLDTCPGIAFEATNNISTVASLNKEDYFMQRFRKANVPEAKKGGRMALVRGLSNGYTNAVMYIAMGAIFWYGLHLVNGDKDWMYFSDEPIEFVAVIKVLMGVTFGAFAAGNALGMAPDYAEAVLAARRVFFMLQRKSKRNPESTEGTTINDPQGKLEFRNVHFTYPNRPDMKVLKGLNLTINPGESVALVGQSGCGKSTVIQLIERFYDPDEGQILLDGVDIRTLNINWLRKTLGFVQQEPVLMNRSIAENIRQGQADLLGDIIEQDYKFKDTVIHNMKLKPAEKGPDQILPMNEVVACAESANIADFITEQPDQYDTVVGLGGGKLSGGQKQRVAIARTLMRKPKVLLLDEATSALDNESEQRVNEALDAARKGRTTVMIAHRLSTVKTADRIACIDNGQVVETGAHTALLNKKGVYYNLVKAQL